MTTTTQSDHPDWAFDGADFHRQPTIALEHLAMVGELFAIAAADPRLSNPLPQEHSS